MVSICENQEGAGYAIPTREFLSSALAPNAIRQGAIAYMSGLSFWWAHYSIRLPPAGCKVQLKLQDPSLAPPTSRNPLRSNNLYALHAVLSVSGRLHQEKSDTTQ